MQKGAAATDVQATSVVRSHLEGITATRAADTTGYSNDPYCLLNSGGRLLTGESGRRTMMMQLKPSDFLRETLTGSRKYVTGSILPMFGKRLVAAKLAQTNKVLLYMNMGIPRVTYFAEDRPLMQRVLTEMMT